MHRHHLLLLTLLLITISPITTAAQDAPASKPVPNLITSRLAPADTLFYLALNADPGSEQAQLANDLLIRMGAQPLIDLFLSAVGALSDQISTQTGAEPLALAPLIQGELAIAVRIDPAALADVTRQARDLVLADPVAAGAVIRDRLSEFLDPVLIARPRDPNITAELLPTLLTLGATAGPPTISLESGVPVLTQPGQNGLPATASAQIGDMLLFAFDAEDLSPSIAIAAGASESLVTQADFQALRKAAPGPTLLYGYTSALAAQQAIDAVVTGLAGDQAAWLTGLLRWLLAPNGSQVDAVRALDPGLRWDTLRLRDCPASGCEVDSPIAIPPAIRSDTTLLALASPAGIPLEFSAVLTTLWPAIHLRAGDLQFGTLVPRESGRSPNLHYAAVRAMLPSTQLSAFVFIDLTLPAIRLGLPSLPFAALSLATWQTPDVTGDTRILVASSK